MLNRKFKQTYIVLSVVLVLLGICMLIFPAFFAYTICRIIGAVCIIHGIMRLVGYFSNDLYKIAFQFDLALGIASIILGLVIIFNTEGFVSLVPIIIGIFTLVSGTLKIQSSVDAKRFGLSTWWLLLLCSVVTMLFGMVLILCPLESMSAIISVMGISLIIDGIQSLFLVIYTVKYRK